MKRVTTKITTKTPSASSISITTTKTQKPKVQSSGYGQPKKVTTVSSKTSVTAVKGPGGLQQTRTETSITTKTQTPIAQAASNWQSGLRSSGMSYAQRQQQLQLQAQQAAIAAQEAAMPRVQIPRAVPREIANVAQSQYRQLMDDPVPPPLQQRRIQAPQQQFGGGQRRQQSAMPPPQQRQMQQPQQRQMQQPQQRQMQQPQQRQMQQPQQRQMQQPQQQQQQQRQRQTQQSGFQSRMQQPGSRTAMMQPNRVIATAAPANLLAPPPPRRSPVSPGTREFEMFEGFSPETMQEYQQFEVATAPRPRARLQPQNRQYGQPQFASPSPQRPTVSTTAEQQYQALLSPSPKGPCGPVTCASASGIPQSQPRRRMQQPGFMAATPSQQGMSAAEQQYAALMNSPEYRASPSPEQRRHTPSPPRDRSMRQSPQQQQMSIADQQYAALLDSPDPRRPSPRDRSGQSSHASDVEELTADIAIPTAASGQPTDLELAVDRAIKQKSLLSPDTPLLAEGQIQRLATPHESPSSGLAMVQTPMGPMPAETQLLIEGAVRRTPTDETVTRHVLAVEGGMVDERETAHLSPGKGMKRPKTPESMELIVCSSEVRMAAGYRETTSKVVYETTDELSSSPSSRLPAEVTPQIVSQLILEESADVDRATKLHAPDLKHSSPLTYGIKKRVNALQLNMMDVQELEETVTWPPPRADQAQEDPHPELLASMMITEEKGLTMGSTPDQLYSALFGAQEPVKADEGMVEVNSVASHPLHDVVVPATAAPRDLHILAMTPELASAAVAAQTAIVSMDDSEAMRPSDGAYSERVLGDKKEAMDNVKVRNVGHRDGPPVKYPVIFDADKAQPWEVDKFDSVIRQVGAIPTSILEASVVAPSASEAAEELRDYTADGIEYLLNMNEGYKQLLEEREIR